MFFHKTSLKNPSQNHKINMLTEVSEAGFNVTTPINVGNYHIESRISSGSFSVVFLVHHVSTHEKFAMKVVNRARMIEASTIYQLEQELRIMETSSHPNIVKLQEIIYSPENVYIIMELCKCDLLSEIADNGILDKYEINRLFSQILNGLSYLHNKGIAHHDLKPENILLDKDRNIKLTDFGSAFTKTPPKTAFGGTLYYMAPEVFKESDYDYKKADIWTLGIILYVLTTSSFPWPTLESDIETLKRILNVDFHIPFYIDQEFALIIERCLQLDPEKRPTLNQLMTKTERGIPLINTKGKKRLIASNISTSILVTQANYIIRPKIRKIRNSSSLKVGFPVGKTS
ncbi:CAMK family protein kinase [Tritrichomonas foetus]|uniref:CAMK family protein kinase n=1 Tax=Tritrichomonas foetus TaxID=1144522 RepID=A0A1J4L2F1_9EUKA|nr:CAMK family protein kinase [Tritrichomonas foetus]|eukprot:OHT16140.1 CAMK family protein kinase [Tritrichomonas foetus]